MDKAYDIIRAALLRVSANTPGGTFQDNIDKTAKEIIYDLTAHGLLKHDQD